MNRSLGRVIKSVRCRRGSLCITQWRSGSSSSSSFETMLQPHHTSVVKEEAVLLGQLYTALATLDPDSPDLSVIKDTMSGIDDLFMVVVVGEFNSGKSTLINSLLGGDYLKCGVLPTTAKVCVLRYINSIESRTWRSTDNLLLKDFEEIDLPVEWLQHIAIVDTPGTNAIIAQHEKITHQVIPRADLVLFVTSAERPVSESEASFLRKISQWGKKVIMVVNKMDIVQPAERDEIVAFVTQNSATILGTRNPLPVFGVSGKQGLSAKLKSSDNKGNSWDSGNMVSLERYLLKILGKEEIIRNKLENPLNVADRVVATAEGIISERQQMLEGDSRVLEFIEENMDAFVYDIERDVRYFRQQIHVVLNGLVVRGDRFLDENISIFKPQLLFDSKAFEEAFKREVLIDIESPVEDIIGDVSELISKRARAQAEAVSTYIGTRPSKYAGKIIGTVRSGAATSDDFHTSRHVLLERLRRDSGDVMRTHTQAEESARVTNAVRNCVQQIAALQAVSVVSLGGLISAHMLDVTGVAVLSGFAASTLLLLPYRRNVMKQEFADKIKVLESRLDEVLTNNIETQLHGVKEKIGDSIGPYSRFVRVENKKTAEVAEEMKFIKAAIAKVRSQIR